jgi:hypothetical protein
VLASLHFTTEIDLTGVATLVLAVATAGLAWWTAIAVRQGNTAIERANRPVLVPTVDRTQSFRPWASTGGYPLEPTPNPGDEARYYVPVSNVGMGPALRVTGALRFGDRCGVATEGIETAISTAGIAHTEPFAVLVFPCKPSTAAGFMLSVAYEDVAGKKWRTVGRYALEDRAYHDVTIVEL